MIMAKRDYASLDDFILAYCRGIGRQHPVWAELLREEAAKLFADEGLSDWMLQTRIKNTISRRLTKLRHDGKLQYTKKKTWRTVE